MDSIDPADQNGLQILMTQNVKNYKQKGIFLACIFTKYI